MKNENNQKVSAVGTIMIQARMDDSRVRVVLGVVYSLLIPVLLETSFIDRFVKGILPLKRKIVLYNSKLVPIHEVKGMRQEHKKKVDKAKDELISKDEHA